MQDFAEHYEELRCVIDTAADAIISIDADGTIRTFNLAAEHMFGYAAEVAIGSSVNILMPAPDRDRHDGYIGHYLETGEASIIGIGRNVRCQRADGSEFPGHLAISETEVGGRKLFTAIIHDLSTRRALEVELHRSREEHRLTLKHAPIGIAILNRAGRVIEVNQAITKMTDYREHELVGKPAVRFLHSDDQLLVRNTFRALVDSPRTSSISVHKIRRADGEYVFAQLNGAVVHDADGEAELLICMLQDLTDQRRIELELQVQRERLAHMSRVHTMGEMAVGLAHELNQPLTAIANYAQAGARMLKSDDIDTEALEKACHRIAQQARRAGSIIDKVRTLTRRQMSERERIDLPKLLTGLLDLAVIDARHLGLGIERSLAAVPMVYGDPTQLEQVTLNFVRNALDATKAAANGADSILVTTSTRADGWAEVCVSDCGDGIEPAARDRVFEPFYTSKNDGMGMGLSISKGIIDSHDGDIGFRDNEGRGTTFWFALPPASDASDD